MSLSLSLRRFYIATAPWIGVRIFSSEAISRGGVLNRRIASHHSARVTTRVRDGKCNSLCHNPGSIAHSSSDRVLNPVQLSYLLLPWPWPINHTQSEKCELPEFASSTDCHRLFSIARSFSHPFSALRTRKESARKRSRTSSVSFT